MAAEPDVPFLWANSGDSHLDEPPDLWDDLPARLRERLPRSEKDPDGEFETVFVDGQSFRRKLPKWQKMSDAELAALIEAGGGEHAAGLTTDAAGDPRRRLGDLDREGIWAEVIYPSLGIWAFNIRHRETLREGTKVLNDWANEFQRHSDRFVCCASLPLADLDDAVDEIERTAEAGFKIAFLPVRPPDFAEPYHHDSWERVWAALESAGMHIGFHIGTEPHTPDRNTGVVHTGPGGAVLNYVETTYGGQRAVTQMIASGALDRHPDLRVLVSEGGATWGPFIADRMDEGYRQHGFAVRPRLSKQPSSYLYDQVYASFQHDRSAVGAAHHLGWRNVLWGSDYPHTEGTFGHTQKTLHDLFDDVPAEISKRITVGAFQELFPHVPPPPS